MPVTSAVEVAAAVARSARPHEHVEVVDPAVSGAVLDSSMSPEAPTMAAPSPPPQAPAHATTYQSHLYHGQRKAYETKLASDRRALERALAAQLDVWSSSVGAAVSRTPAASMSTTDASRGLSDAVSYFSSLGQAGVGLGTRRVVVLMGAPAILNQTARLAPYSLSGVTVIVTNFGGDQAAEAEWQADLLQAGANRATVLSPGTGSELGAVIAQGLDGQAGPAPTVVHFALNQSNLDAAARATLSRLAAVLTRACPDAPATILGFADPVGSSTRNGQLATERASNTMEFLVSQHVAVGRLFATGYGTGLPAAPSNGEGVQPLDRRAVVVIDPAAGQQRGCGPA
jgi:outer membrane protein OmpA-like peptidoglycan-associated protein